MEGVIPADGVLSASLHSDEGSGERCSQLLGSDKFRALVKAITFHTSENLEAAPWNEYNDLDFEEHRVDTFLRPIASQLKEVKLYTIHSQWGVYPACNLEDIHFPQLEKLALGNYVFAYDWQVDWIVSHGSTLKTLVLDNCPITYCGNVGWELHDLEPGANFTVDDTDERPSKV
ncbi:hypothetical protein Slin15195_G093920 [Septoria linicola]|uniref:Uncharacterized protein n=1 Tax=Septoria linicola TaxID=215465 RepID=A0A9Q9EP24_9PEZI|nr:hypothetical protein Slin15195_G093920 [Septoria linicola]